MVFKSQRCQRLSSAVTTATPLSTCSRVGSGNERLARGQVADDPFPFGVGVRVGEPDAVEAARKAREMMRQSERLAGVHGDELVHPVAVDEAAVEHGHLRLHRDLQLVRLALGQREIAVGEEARRHFGRGALPHAQRGHLLA